MTQDNDKNQHSEKFFINRRLATALALLVSSVIALAMGLLTVVISGRLFPDFNCDFIAGWLSCAAFLVSYVNLDPQYSE